MDRHERNAELHERRHLEVERKYEVSLDATVPSFHASRFVVSEPRVFDLTATYFDTNQRDLAARRVAVRHRTGGTDAGWHMKVRRPWGVEETEWPPSPAMPDALREAIRSLVGGDLDELRIIGRITTQRTSRMLSNARGDRLIELVDDTVSAHDETTGVSRVWREWEAELLAAAWREALTADELLDEVEDVLVAAGAMPALSESKIGRALGTSIDAAKRQGATAEQLASLAVTEVADRLAAETANGASDGRVGPLRSIAHTLASSSK